MADRFIIVDQNNKMLCEGTVKDLYRDEGVFRTEHGVNAMELFRRGEQVRFVFQEGRKGLFQGEIVDLSFDKIVLEDIHSIAKYVKEDVRLETYFETRVFDTTEEGQIFAYEAVVADISAGGVRLMTETALPHGRTLEVAIPFATEYILAAMDIVREIPDDPDAERLRLMQLNDKWLREIPLRHSYGCKFHELKSVEENMIRARVFQVAARKGARKGGR